MSAYVSSATQTKDPEVDRKLLEEGIRTLPKCISADVAYRLAVGRPFNIHTDLWRPRKTAWEVGVEMGQRKVEQLKKVSQVKVEQLKRLPQVVTSLVEASGKLVEQGLRDRKNDWQQYYVTRPVYKACVGLLGAPLAATISFIASDLIIHQPVVNAGVCLTSHLSSVVGAVIENPCDIGLYPWVTAAWMVCALPVIYVKYKRDS